MNLSVLSQGVVGGFRDQYGRDIERLWHERPVLMVFLRHAGCTFCRETLGRLAGVREEIEQAGTAIVAVHMSRESRAQRLFELYGLADLPRISDPECRLYRMFGLRRGTPWQLFGPKVIGRGMKALLAGYGIGALEGDGFQLPGAFLVFRGRILKAFRAEHAADQTDFSAMKPAPGDVSTGDQATGGADRPDGSDQSQGA